MRDVELREEIPVARLRRGRDVEPPFQDLHTSVPSTPKLTRTAHTLRADAAAGTARSPSQGASWHGRCAVPRAVGADPHRNLHARRPHLSWPRACGLGNLDAPLFGRARRGHRRHPRPPPALGRTTVQTFLCLHAACGHDAPVLRGDTALALFVAKTQKSLWGRWSRFFARALAYTGLVASWARRSQRARSARGGSSTSVRLRCVALRLLPAPAPGRGCATLIYPSLSPMRRRAAADT